MQLLPLLCAAVLAGQGSLQEARALVQQFGTWREDTARAALSKFPPEIRQAALIEGLKNPNPLIQEEAAWSLGAFKDAVTREALVRYLPESRGHGRNSAVHYLARTEYQIPAQILKEMLAEDTSQQAALHAIEQQKRTSLAAAAGPLLGSPDLNTPSSARRALISLGEPGIREIERQLMQGQSRARLGAAAAIDELPPNRRRRLYPIALSDRDSEVHKQALYTYSQVPEVSALPQVLRLTRSSDRQVQFAAIRAIAAVRDSRASESLLSFAKMPPFEATAVYGLARQGDPAVLPSLAQLRSKEARQAFASNVLRFGAASVVYAEELLRSENIDVRLAVIRSITKDQVATWSARDLEGLLSLVAARLYDPNPDVQDAALRVLRTMGQTAELPEVPFTDDLSKLAGAMVWDRSGHAAASLGLAGERAIPHLLPLLRHPEAAVRARAVAALSVVRDPDTFKRLAALFGDPDPGVRMATTKAFVHIGPAGLPDVIRAAAHSPEAIEAVQKLRPRADDVVRRMLRSPVRDERLGALRVVGFKAESNAGVTDLLRDPDREIRYYAAVSLASRRDPVAIPVLMELLPVVSREKRLRIIGWLGNYGGTHGLAELSRLYQSRSWERRYVVAEAITRRDNVDSLLPLLRDTVPKIREDAVRSLGRSKDARAVGPIRAMLNDPSPEVRRATLYALGELKDVDALNLVLAKLDDPDRDVRWVACTVLGQLKDPRAVPALIRIVESRDDYICRAAAVSLGQIGDRRATPVLLSLLEDASSQNRSFAAQALGFLGDPAAIPALRDHLTEIDYRVVREAQSAIAQINR